VPPSRGWARRWTMGGADDYGEALPAVHVSVLTEACTQRNCNARRLAMSALLILFRNQCQTVSYARPASCRICKPRRADRRFDECGRTRRRRPRRLPPDIAATARFDGYAVTSGLSGTLERDTHASTRVTTSHTTKSPPCEVLQREYQPFARRPRRGRTTQAQCVRSISKSKSAEVNLPGAPTSSGYRRSGLGSSGGSRGEVG
jgi:hypothetical protein